MDTVMRISALAVAAAVSCCLIRTQNGALSLLLTLAASVAILLLAFHFLSPIMEVFGQLRTMTGLSDTATAPMLKVTGIGLLTQIAGSVCEDAQEKALSRAVEIGGTVLSLYASIPLLTAVLDLLEEILKG